MDEFTFSDEEKLKTGFKLLGDLFSGEIKLIRTILISSMTIILICVLLYFNYILIGQFFTTILFSFIVNLALKSIKTKCLHRITKHFTKKKYFIPRCAFIRLIKSLMSYLSSIIKTIKQVIYIRQQGKEAKIVSRSSLSTNSHRQRANSTADSTVEDSVLDKTASCNTIFNNMSYLISICLFYVIVFKLEIYLSITIILVYFCADLLIRLCTDCILLFLKYIDTKFLNYSLIFDKKQYKGELRDNIHSILSLIIIISFTLILSSVLLLSLWLIFIDAQSIVLYVKSNDYMNYFKSILPDNIQEYYNDEEYLSKFYHNNVFSRMKSFETFINMTLEEQFKNTTEIKGNYTLYDITNNVVNFLKDPQLIINTFIKTAEEQGRTIENMPLVSFIEDRCEIYDGEILSRITRFVKIEYIRKLYCAIRLLIDRANVDINFTIFSTHLKRGYKFLLETIKFIAGTIVLNLLSVSIELANYVMLFILFLTCLFNFLKTKDDFITGMLTFLPYPKKQIDEIDQSFHNSVQGVFMSTAQIFISHTLLTWIIFDIFNIKFVFLLSLLAGVFTFIPIIPPWLILLPANALKVFSNDFTFSSILLLNLGYYFLIYNMDNDIYLKNMNRFDPYITGLSFVMGMYTFGFRGFIYGPVILCVSLTVIDVIRILIVPQLDQKKYKNTY